MLYYDTIKAHHHHGRSRPSQCSLAGLQMPDYFTGLYYSDAPQPTYDFSQWAPDAMVIDLGTNDLPRAITRMNNGSSVKGPGTDRSYLVNIGMYVNWSCCDGLASD